MERERAGAWTRIALAAALALHGLFVVSLSAGFLDPLFVEAQQGHGQASDLFGIYQAGANLIHGHSIYDSPDYRHEAPQVVPFYYFYRYLPPTAYAFAPVAALIPPWPAYWLWVIGNELLMALMVLVILRDRRWPAPRRRLVAALWLGSFPFYIEQFMGQFSFTMAVLIYLLWRCDLQPPPRGAREGCVRLAWAASATLKSYTALLAVPYLRDRLLRRVLIGGALGAAVCAPYFAARPEDLRQFLRLNLSPLMAIYKGAFGLQTALRDLVSHLPSDLTGISVTLLGRAIDFEHALLFGLTLALFAGGLWATWRWRALPQRRTYDVALWTTFFFLAFKSVWEYHYVMMLPVVTALYLTGGSRLVMGLGIGMGLPTLYAAAPLLAGVPAGADLSAWPGWFRVLHFHVKALPTLLLFAWLLNRARRRGDQM